MGETVRAQGYTAHKMAVNERKYLRSGSYSAATKGLYKHLGVDQESIHNLLIDPIAAIVAEFERAGTRDLECLHYVRYEAAGSSGASFHRTTARLRLK